jgi:hypothetical protein
MTTKCSETFTIIFQKFGENLPKRQNNGQKYFYFSHLCEILHTEKRLVFMYFTPLLFGDLIVHICIPSSLFLKFLQLFGSHPAYTSFIHDIKCPLCMAF